MAAKKATLVESHLAKCKLERVAADIERSEEELGATHLLLEDAPRTYAGIDPVGWRRLNQAIFKKLMVSPSGIEGADLTDEFA